MGVPCHRPNRSPPVSMVHAVVSTAMARSSDSQTISGGPACAGTGEAGRGREIGVVTEGVRPRRLKYVAIRRITMLDHPTKCHNQESRCIDLARIWTVNNRRTILRVPF